MGIAEETPLDTRPHLLFFYNPKSGHSRRTEGHIAQVLQAGRNHDTFRRVRISVEERPELAEALEVDAAPTILVVENQRVRRRIVCPKGVPAIREGLAEWLR
jgi:thioredoxin-like negative regulator of GroEL